MENKLSKALVKASTDIKGRLDGTYQRAGVEWMLQRELGEGVKGGILADDMGLGKTMQAIACMRGNPMKTLVVSMVGPLNQWKDALCDFGGYRPIIMNASFQGSLPQNIDVVLTAYSSFQKKIPPRCLYEKPWGRIILDEGHTIKNENSKTHKEIAKLEAEVKWVLSGTTIQNSEKDLYALMGWIGVPKSVQVDDIVATYVLRRTQEELSVNNPRLALPKLETKVVRIPFATKEEEAFYSKVEEYFSQCAIDNPADAMTCLTRCRQACTDPMVYMSSMAKKKKGKHPVWDEGIARTKLEYIIDDVLLHHKKEKCLIFCMWTEEMTSLTEALKSKGVASIIYDGSLSRDNKEAALYNFKHTEIPVLLIQINCGATGLNLQCASRVYITSPNWNPCIELQAIGRAYRKGQVHVVTCMRVIIEGTVEERCMEIQEAKMLLIMEAMKDNTMANKLGRACTNLDDINIADLFRTRKKRKTLQVMDETDGEDEPVKRIKVVSPPPEETATCDIPIPPMASPPLPEISDEDFWSFLDSLLMDG